MQRVEVTGFAPSWCQMWGAACWGDGSLQQPRLSLVRPELSHSSKSSNRDRQAGKTSLILHRHKQPAALCRLFSHQVVLPLSCWGSASV